jgi:hypothetical protein
MLLQKVPQAVFHARRFGGRRIKGLSYAGRHGLMDVFSVKYLVTITSNASMWLILITRKAMSLRGCMAK